MAWVIQDGKLTNTEFLPLPEKAMAKPYPLSVWWIEDGKLKAGLMPEIEELGAFCHASELKKVSIPTTCAKIGEFAFRFTSLKSVKLPEDCEYYPTSFPEGCVVSGGILIDTKLKTPSTYIRELYKDFDITAVSRQNNLSRGEYKELIIKNY